MINTFKETITNLQDKSFGQKVVILPIKSVIWYWTKYLLLILLLIATAGVFLMTNQLPQLPHLIEKEFPEGTVSSRNNILTSDIQQPLILSEGKEFSLVFNLNGDVKDLDNYSTGIVILRDKLISKTEDGQIHIQNYDKIPDFSIDKHQLSKFITSHYFQIWLSLFGVLLLMSVLFIIFTTITRSITYCLWAAIIWIVGRWWLKKSLSYLGSLKLVIYSSVIPLVVSAFLSFAPNQILSILNTAMFIYICLIWLWNIPNNHEGASKELQLVKNTHKKSSKSK